MAWIIGDTSWRTKNQIGMYALVFRHIYENEGITDENLYETAYNEGLKRKEKSSKKSDVSLLLKTLKNFNLIFTKNKQNFVTDFGKVFVNLLKIENKVNEKIKKKFNFDWDTLLWFSIILNQKVLFENKEIQPFKILIKKLVDNDGRVDKNWLIDWTLDGYREKSNIENWKENWKYEKIDKYNKKQFQLLKEFVANKEQEKLEKILKEITGGPENVLKRNVINMISRFYCNLEIDIYKVNGQSFNKKIEKVSNFFTNVSKEILKSDLKTFSKNLYLSKLFCTAKKDYLSINSYWIDNLNMFDKITSYNYKISDNVMSFFKWIIKNIKDEKFLHEFIIENDFEFNKFIDNLEYLDTSKITLPYTFDEVKEYFYNYQEYFDDNLKTIARYRLNAPVTNATIVEYFTNLYVYFSFKQNDYDIDFIKMCNTSLSNDLKPIIHASSGKPDGQFEIDDINFTVESTKTSGMQMVSSESFSILKHGTSYYDKNGNKTIVLFFAPKFSANFINAVDNTIRSGIYLEQKGSEQKFIDIDNRVTVNIDYYSEGLNEINKLDFYKVDDTLKKQKALYFNKEIFTKE